MSDIIWPERYTQGTTDNYVSNEIIVAGLTAADVRPFLNNTSAWPTYYSNASDIRFHVGSGPELRRGARFRLPPSASRLRRRSRNMSRQPSENRPGWPGMDG